MISNPAVTFHLADARSYVRAQAARDQRYDVVIADLFHPQQAGVGNLYTREHFASVRRILAPGGLFMQWLSLYELPPEDLAVVLRTFLDVFPHASGWYAHFNAETGVLGLCGSDRPLGLDWDRSARISASTLSSTLSPVLLDRPMELFGSFVTERQGLEQLARGAAEYR